MSKRELAALEALNLKRGDVVRTAFRGGVRQGPVKEIQKEPPKVVFSRRRKGQPDKEVKHNPSTLEKVTAESEEDSPELKKSRASDSARKRSTEASGGKAKVKAGGSKKAGGKGKGREAAASPPSPKGGRVSKRQAAKAAPPSPKTPTKAAAPKRAEGRSGGGTGGKRSGGGGSKGATRSGTRRTRGGGRRG
ncbi:hypothetical protein ABPG75_013707 [Micractinium tetrahymenae]